MTNAAPQSRPLFLLTLCLLLPALASAVPEPAIRIGITPGGHEPEHVSVFTETKQALEAHFGKDRVSFETIHVDKLTEDVLANRLSFFISTAGLSRRMMNKGTKDLLTITSKRFPDPNHAYGSVFVVRADSPYRKLDDLRGRRLVANRPMGFYGYVAAMGELEARGYDHLGFFSKQVFLDAGSFSVLASLLRGEADAATVPSCFLEDNFPADAPERRALRILEPKPGIMPCRRSTADYPNWTLSAAPGTSPELAREVMQILLNASDASDYRWSVATDFSAVDELYRNMKTGVYDVLKGWTLKGFWEEYRPWILAGAALLVLLALYSLLLKHLVSRRTAELSRALSRQLELQKVAAAAEERFESLQKVGLIGQMSSMIAHELRQPLSSLSAYIHGLLRMTEKPDFDASAAREALFRMAAETQDAESIVNKVRAYARRKPSDREHLDASAVVKQALEVFRASGRFSGRVLSELEGSLPIFADSMEIELAVLNLLRNAADALHADKTPRPEIRVSAKKADGHCLIRISDNGSPLSEKELRALGTPLQSTKPSGLGLGLVLVRSIVENHGGKLLFEAGPGSGLSAVIKLPLEKTS
ncbi:sensor histidine kinase [uncultured Sutterella sp.]|mgnify:CR=1 FL=1|uniref:sensor histidine kinase n=1 Tax=uncultured Sutterella sp. TaxID=286133 RepID=UPI00262BA52D|nr:sensor histidine kinase [uncultured Sutterella sp.]